MTIYQSRNIMNVLLILLKVINTISFKKMCNHILMPQNNKKTDVYILFLFWRTCIYFYLNLLLYWKRHSILITISIWNSELLFLKHEMRHCYLVCRLKMIVCVTTIFFCFSYSFFYNNYSSPLGAFFYKDYWLLMMSKTCTKHWKTNILIKCWITLHMFITHFVIIGKRTMQSTFAFFVFE